MTTRIAVTMNTTRTISGQVALDPPDDVLRDRDPGVLIDWMDANRHLWNEQLEQTGTVIDDETEVEMCETVPVIPTYLITRLTIDGNPVSPGDDSYDDRLRLNVEKLYRSEPHRDGDWYITGGNESYWNHERQVWDTGHEFRHACHRHAYLMSQDYAVRVAQFLIKQTIRARQGNPAAGFGTPAHGGSVPAREGENR